jgi:glycosyltransferase involved in cell wall biosynthesis
MNGFLFAISLKSNHAASRGVAALAFELARRGRDVAIVTEQIPPAGWDELRDLRIPVTQWPSPRPVHISDALVLAKTIDTMRPRCIAAVFGAGNISMAVGFLKRVPVRICWYQTLFSQITTDSPCSCRFCLLKLSLLRARKRLFYAIATHLVPLSGAASLDLQENFGVSSAKCKVLPHGLKDRWKHKRPRYAHCPSAMPTVLCVCRMNPSKGPQILLEAAGILVQRGVKFTIRFGGDGPLLSQLRQRAEQLRITPLCPFLGAIVDQELENELSEAEIVAVPSLEEAYGLMILEGMAASLPVVAFRTGATPEIIEHRKHGLLAQGKSAEALADALQELLQKGSFRQTLGQAGRERFLQGFDENVLTKRHADWLESL